MATQTIGTASGSGVGGIIEGWVRVSRRAELRLLAVLLCLAVASPALMVDAAARSPEPPEAARPLSLPGAVTAGAHALLPLASNPEVTLDAGWRTGWDYGDDVATPLGLVALEHELSNGFVRLAFWDVPGLLIDDAEQVDIRSYLLNLEGVEGIEEVRSEFDGHPAQRFDFTWSGADRMVIPFQAPGLVSDHGFVLSADVRQHWVVVNTDAGQLLITWTVEGGAEPALEAEAEALVLPVLLSITFPPPLPIGLVPSAELPEARSVEPEAVLTDMPGNSYVAVLDDAFIVTTPPTGQMHRIDPETNTVNASWPLSIDTLGIDFGHGALWLADFPMNLVHRVDPLTGVESATIQVGANPSRVVTTPDAVWVANHRGGTLSRIDPLTNETVTTVRVSGPGIQGPQEMLASGQDLWVHVPGFDTVIRIDTKTGDLTAVVETTAPCFRMLLAAGAVWVRSCLTDEVIAIDAVTGEVRGRIRTGGYGTDGVFEAGGLVWVATTPDDPALPGRMIGIDPTTMQIVDAVGLREVPRSARVAFGSVWVIYEDTGTFERLPLDAFVPTGG